MRSLRRGVAYLRGVLFLALVGVFVLDTADLAGAAPTGSEVDSPRPPRHKVLIIALDAIPYDVAARLKDPAVEDEPLFAHLRGPVPLISTFPSTTTVAFTGLFGPLGMAKPPGYEARFFDWEQRRLRGGGPRSYGRIAFSWREFFDWKTEGVVRKALGFVRPIKFGRKEVKRAIEAFVESDRQIFFAYVTATDGVGHLKGPARQGEVLRHLDRDLKELYRKYPDQEFRTVVFSDHGIAGGKPLRNVRRKSRKAVKRAGFHLSRRLTKENDLVFVSYGLVSSFVVFTWEGKEAQAADALASVPGVALCATQDPGGWRVVSDQGSARIRRRPSGSQEEWSYQPVDADPLGYRTVVKRLEERAGGAGDVWFPDDWWFEATSDLLYPDGLYRIAKAFELVSNPASAVCSVAPGYMYGALLTDHASYFTGGRLKWTHGALDKDATVGFIMSDYPAWRDAPVLRFDRALEVFAPLMTEGAGDE